MNMKYMEITKHDFEEFKGFQIKHRFSWSAIFSTNCNREIWVYGGPGYTHEERRIHVQGNSKVLDRVAEEYLRIRHEGGRFYLTETGAFYSSEDGKDAIQFLTFSIQKQQ